MINLDVPTLSTERLVLRGFRLDDFAECAAMWADPIVTRYIGGKPRTAEDIWSKLLRHVGHWALLGFGYWSIREKVTERYVGEAGFADLRRTIEPPLEAAGEIGWALAPWAHGRGFATEAAQAAIGWFSDRFGPVRTVCLIDPDNVRSIRVAEKCGYREERRATYESEATIVFAR